METKTIEGYAITFNKQEKINDAYYEVIDPHAFDNANLKDIVLVKDFSGKYPVLARTRNNTLEVKVDEKGLYFKGNVRKEFCNLHRPYHFGIGFRVKEEEWNNCDTNCPTRIIKEFDRIYVISIDGILRE